MNQILHTKDSQTFIKEKSSNYNRKKRIFKLQFILSVILFLTIIIIYVFNLDIKNAKELTSKQITSNYNIERLYNNSASTSQKTYNHKGQVFNVIGMIEIPKINIYYPIISEASDELLKISPCRIAGPMPNEDGNLCIAGHNYDNYKFFSKLSNLSKDDVIIIHDLQGQKILYSIYNIYEVSANDLSPLSDSEEIQKQVTLITCNNFNSESRIIIQARKK